MTAAIFEPSKCHRLSRSDPHRWAAGTCPCIRWPPCFWSRNGPVETGPRSLLSGPIHAAASSATGARYIRSAQLCHAHDRAFEGRDRLHCRTNRGSGRGATLDWAVCSQATGGARTYFWRTDPQQGARRRLTSPATIRTIRDAAHRSTSGIAAHASPQSDADLRRPHTTTAITQPPVGPVQSAMPHHGLRALSRR